MTDRDEKRLRIGHSPDPDDAFMWYPLAEDPSRLGPDGAPLTPKIDTRGYRFEHVLEDIQALNERSERGELEITALSIHQYPYVASSYALTACGASMGDGYGPMVVAAPGFALERLVQGARLAIPGRRTSAWLALQLLLRERGLDPGEIDADVVAFDRILPAVQAGEYDAGLIIHEGQLTYPQTGLVCVVDLGAWWTRSRGVPLPLGGNAVRRDLADEGPRIARVLMDSIEWALTHREEAVRFALQYARGMDEALAERFVGLYVNDWTLDYGERGREALRRFVSEGVEAGLVPDCGPVDLVEPEAQLAS